MIREEALELVKTEIKTPNLIKHVLAVEACMRRLAREWGEDEAEWGLSGLLHDLDYERTKDDFSQHGLVSGRLLEERKVSPRVVEAVKAHAGHAERTSKMAKALFAVDPLTGLVVAAALMHPEKKLSALGVVFVLNRFREKGFARGANRGQIGKCEELGVTLEEFVRVCLEAMKGISGELGL